LSPDRPPANLHPDDDPPPAIATTADEPLRAYVAAKQAVAALLRDLQQLADRTVPSVAGRARDLTVRLAEDRFQLVVIGQFKRGKTSLVNAIIGRPLLPTGAIPVTSVITALRYGPSVRVVIRRAGQPFDETIPVGRLPEVLTERGNSGNEQHVTSADIEVPAPFLRRGLRFVDTPGIGSARERNTAATLGFLPEADAALFVTGADAPLSDSELAFLDAAREHIRKLFFVVNKIDQVSDTDRDAVLEYAARQLADRLGVDAVTLFPVSATRALATARGTTAADASGLPVLEHALSTFLNADRQHVFLVSILDRAMHVLDEARFTLRLHERASSPSDEERTREALQRQYRRQDDDRRAAIERARRQMADRLDQAIDPSLRRFVTETRDAVLADLPHASLAWLESPDVAHAAREWVNGQVRRHVTQWLSRQVDLVDRITRTSAHEAEVSIAATIAQTLGVTAGAYGLDQPPRIERDTDAWQWTPPPVVLPATVPGAPEFVIEASRVPVPRTLARRRVVDRIARRLTPHLEGTAAALREMIASHFRAAADALDAASARALDEERRRVGLSIASDEPVTGTLQPATGEDDAVAHLESLRTRVTSARDALLRQEPLDSLLTDAPQDTITEPAQTQVMSEVESARLQAASETCPICAVMSGSLFDFLCHHQYAITASRSTQREFLATRGLCPVHTWHIEAVASPRGLSESYPPLLDLLATRLQAMARWPVPRMTVGLRQLRSNATDCPACAVLRQAERDAGDRLHAQFQTADGRAALLRSPRLCLAHLERFVAGLTDDEAALLVRAHAERLIELAETMRDYVLKVDARRRDLLTSDEARAYGRALIALAGERDLVVPGRET
jgi:tRNA U34 5-carboxymethylaminomethyl modifying GTPase MnmE/TrmE